MQPSTAFALLALMAPTLVLSAAVPAPAPIVAGAAPDVALHDSQNPLAYSAMRPVSGEIHDPKGARIKQPELDPPKQKIKNPGSAKFKAMQQSQQPSQQHDPQARLLPREPTLEPSPLLSEAALGMQPGSIAGRDPLLGEAALDSGSHVASRSPILGETALGFQPGSIGARDPVLGEAAFGSGGHIASREPVLGEAALGRGSGEIGAREALLGEAAVGNGDGR